MKDKQGNDIYCLYAFQCEECGFIFLEPYNPRFSEVPQCADCGGKSVAYNGELTEDLEKAIEEYNEELGISEWPD